MHGSNSPAPSARAIFTEKRTYLRPLDEDSTIFETPDEALDRILGHQRWLWEREQGRPLDLMQEAELAELRDLMVAKKVSASGRVKWMGGTAISRERPSSCFNCSFTEVGTPADVVDVFWLLLQGCGVGFLPVPGLLTGFPKTLKNVEFIGSTRPDKGGAEDNVEAIEDGVWTIVFGDSAKAWSKGVGKLLAEKPRVHTLRIDLSELRPGGKRLKGYGWLSSGWEPLRDGLKIITDVLMKRADSLLDAIDIGDIVNALGTVLSSRRSAQIWIHNIAASSFQDLSPVDVEFIDAKTDRWIKGLGHREQSNNSLVFWNQPDRDMIRALLNRVLHTGEPGFVNGAAAKKRAPEFVGLNPCVTADTWIDTDEGPRQVSELINVPFKANVHGEMYPSKGFWKTGTKKVYRVETNRGYSIRLTEDHKVLVKRGDVEEWVEAKNLRDGEDVILNNNRISQNIDPIDDLGWLLGEVVGDGGYSVTDRYRAYVQFWGNDTGFSLADRAATAVKTLGLSSRESGEPTWLHSSGSYKVSSHGLTDLCASYLGEDKEILPNLEKESGGFVRGFLQGYFDADGTINVAGGSRLSVRLTGTSRKNLQAVHRMLQRLGIMSSLILRKEAGSVNLPDGKGGVAEYITAPLYEVVISKDNISEFVRLVGFSDPVKKQKLNEIVASRCDTRGFYKENFTASVTGVYYDSYEDVFDCTVDEVHRFSANGIIVHNCAEILLPSKGFCNLQVVVFHRFNGDYKGLLRAQYLAGRANYRQTCVSMRDGVLQLQWDDNQSLLRLCGVAPTGFVAWEYAENAPLVRGTAAAARNGANSMADELGTPRPRRVTQVQPAGTVSKVVGLLGDEVHEGAHLSPSRYIFNWVNFSIHDRIVDDLIAAGYRVKKNPSDKTAVLVCFPIAYPGHRLYKEKVVEIDGREEVLELSAETAVDQLERYRFLMENYVDHNCSITVSFDDEDIDSMVDWFEEHWDSYVGVSFLKRNDPTRTAEELGFKYLPQECVSKRMFEEYAATLKSLDMSHDTSDEMLDDLTGCATGACPVR